MPRLQRIVIPGVPHHVAQWAAAGQTLFNSDADREGYIALLADRSRTARLEVWAYCLMDTHVHLVVTPLKIGSLATGVGLAHACYAQETNRKTGRRGHFWAGRYYACALGRSHFRKAIQYIEQNPCRHGMVKHAWQYEWSSAPQHIGRGHDVGLLDLGWWRKRVKAKVWREQLRRPLAAGEVDAIRRHTRRGWPLAGERALETYEKIAGCPVRPEAVGRPSGRTRL